MPTTGYVIAARSIIQAVLETTTGTDPGSGYVTVPIYDVVNPVQHRQDFQTLNRLNDSLASDGGYVKAAFYEHAFKTFVFNSGTTTLPAYATILLPLAGMIKSTIVGAAPTTPTQTHIVAGSLDAVTGYQYKVVSRTDATRVRTVPSVASTTTGAFTNFKVALTYDDTPTTVTTEIYRTMDGGSIFYYLTEVVGTNTGAPIIYTDDAADTALCKTRTAPGALTATSGINYFSPRNIDFDSGTIHTYLGGHRRIGKGVRGNFDASFTAGECMDMNWRLPGVYTAATVVANPNVGCAGPAMPPRAESLTYLLCPNSLGGTTSSTAGVGMAVTPFELKSMTWTPGTQTNNRTSAAATRGVREIGIHSRAQSKMTLTYEVDPAFGFDPIADYDQGVQYGFIITLGTGTNGRVEISMPNLQTNEAPSYQEVDGGIRAFTQSFTMRNHTNCFDSFQWRFF